MLPGRKVKAYFLEVQAAGDTLYTIGVTPRSVEAQVAEIAQELRADPGLSIRKAAAVTGASINTVQKVAAAVGIHLYNTDNLYSLTSSVFSTGSTSRRIMAMIP